MTSKARRARVALWLLVSSALIRVGPGRAGSVINAGNPPAPARDASQAQSVQSEALEAMGVPAWHELGNLGQGARVGILDLGFAGYADLLGLELPAGVIARAFGPQPGLVVDDGPARGTGMAEIVHDVAPAAELYLARIQSHEDLAPAVEWLMQQGVRIIVSAPGWYDLSPGDGTGPLTEVVARAQASDVVWVAAAGDDRERHWCGDWGEPADGDSFRFTPFDKLNDLLQGSGEPVPAGTVIQVYLRWDDWEQVDQDYDLYLYALSDEDPEHRVVASSTDPQTGINGQKPTESLRYVTTADYQYYGLQIRAYHVGRPAHLELFMPGSLVPQYRVASQSLASPSDAPQAMTVGAVSWEAPYAHQAASAQGPTKGPGGVGEGGLLQPMLAGYGGVTTASSGVFEGTAAAAAHVAGAAALVLGRYPTWSATEVQQYLYGHAVRGPWPGDWDTQYGYGRVYLGDVSPAPFLHTWFPIIRR